MSKKQGKAESGAKPSQQDASATEQQTPSQTAAPKANGLQGMQAVPRVISLIVLVAVVLLIGVMFFKVMASFIVPLFLAAVLAVVFKPLHEWSLSVLPGRPQWASLLTTSVISLIVVVPTALLAWAAYAETLSLVEMLLPDGEEPSEAVRVVDAESGPLLKEPGAVLAQAADKVESMEIDQQQIAEASATWQGAIEQLTGEWTDWYKRLTGQAGELAKSGVSVAQYAAKSLVSLGLVGVQALIGFTFSLGIMIFALYYFFADGPSIIDSIMHLSPLDDDYERELLEQFATVSRAVVLATIATAVIQGALAGVGYYAVTFCKKEPPTEATVAESAAESVVDSVATDEESEYIDLPVFLLTVLTMLMAIVPFIGAMAVWGLVAAWVMFMVPGGFWPGLVLAIYGFFLVSSVDNVLKPYILSGQSNLHPLLALLSVFGGVQFLGPIGILVGPMLVVFLQTLLGMLRKELDGFNGEQPEPAATG